MRSSATPTASMSRPSSSSDPQTVQTLDAEPTRSSPGSPANHRGPPSEHTCSRWRRTPGSTHSCTCRQPPTDETSRPRVTWPPSSTGASQSPHRRSRAHCLGYPAFQKHFKIIPFGASIWRSGPARSPASHTKYEETPTSKHVQPVWASPGSRPECRPHRRNRRLAGRHRRSTPKTTDQPEKDNCRWRPLYGNATSTEVSLTAMTTPVG